MFHFDIDGEHVAVTFPTPMLRRADLPVSIRDNCKRNCLLIHSPWVKNVPSMYQNVVSNLAKDSSQYGPNLVISQISVAARGMDEAKVSHTCH